jgi:hypothetical protein
MSRAVAKAAAQARDEKGDELLAEVTDISTLG